MSQSEQIVYQELPISGSSPAQTRAAVQATMQGPADWSAGALATWLNDVKDLEEGITTATDAAGTKRQARQEARRTRRDARREKQLGQISTGLSAAIPKLSQGMTREEAFNVAAQEVRVGFVGLFGGGLIAIVLKALIGWAICRLLDRYFGKMLQQE